MSSVVKSGNEMLRKVPHTQLWGRRRGQRGRQFRQSSTESSSLCVEEGYPSYLSQETLEDAGTQCSIFIQDFAEKASVRFLLKSERPLST